MVEIRYISCPEKFDDLLFNKLLAILPEDLSRRILKYTRWQDAYACLLGRLLLQTLSEKMQIGLCLQDIKYTAFGRPFYIDTVDFNISHSGSFVVIVMSKNHRVGIDIELVTPLEIQDFQSQFREEEWTDIVNSPDIYTRFYYYWTAKEALVKAQGKGLSIPLRDVIVKHGVAEIENVPWFYYKIDISENYAVHMASDKKLDKGCINIEKVKLNDLLARCSNS